MSSKKTEKATMPTPTPDPANKLSLREAALKKLLQEGDDEDLSTDFVLSLSCQPVD